MPKPTYLLLAISTLLLFTVTAEAQKNDEFTLDETYAVAGDGTISLQSDDANVTITGSDRQDVRVVVNYRRKVKGLSFGDYEGFEMIVEEDNGNLNIYEKERDNETRFIVGSSREEYEITIEAPRGVSLNLEGDDETYRISTVDGAISIEADDSDLELKECDGDSFSLEMDDGEILMDGGNGSLKLSLDDGDARILNGNFSDIQYEADDGDLDITTMLSDGGNYRFDLDDGDLVLNIAGGGGEFDISHDDADISTSSEYEEVMADEDRSIYRLPLGNAKISIKTDDGDIVLRVI